MITQFRIFKGTVPLTEWAAVSPTEAVELRDRTAKAEGVPYPRTLTIARRTVEAAERAHPAMSDSKAELLEIASELGLEVPPKATKGEIIAIIEARV